MQKWKRTSLIFELLFIWAEPLKKSFWNVIIIKWRCGILGEGWSGTAGRWSFVCPEELGGGLKGKFTLSELRLEDERLFLPCVFHTDKTAGTRDSVGGRTWPAGELQLAVVSLRLDGHVRWGMAGAQHRSHPSLPGEGISPCPWSLFSFVDDSVGYEKHNFSNSVHTLRPQFYLFRFYIGKCWDCFRISQDSVPSSSVYWGHLLFSRQTFIKHREVQGILFAVDGNTEAGNGFLPFRKLTVNKANLNFQKPPLWK